MAVDWRISPAYYNSSADDATCPPPHPLPGGDGGWGGEGALPEGFWILGWAISGFFALFATICSTSLIVLHLRHWTRPKIQRHIARILLLVPGYAIAAFFSYKFPSIAIFVTSFRDVYEAFAVYAFFCLLLLYLGHDWNAQRVSMQGKPPRRMPPPMCCLHYDPRERDFLLFCKIGIIQLLVERYLLSTFSLIMNHYDRFCPESMDWRYGHIWTVIFNSVAMGVAMFTLLSFYLAVHKDLPGGRPVYQFLSIKFVLFIPYVQMIILQGLVSSGQLRGDDKWSVADIVTAVSSGLICVEMAIASILHVFAFPVAEFADGVDEANKPSFFVALVDCLRPDDLWDDAVLVLMALWGWAGGLGRRKEYTGLALVPPSDEVGDEQLLTPDSAHNS